MLVLLLIHCIDAWNQFPNGSYDDVSKWNQMDVSVKEWQGRLPFFGKIDANRSAVFNEDDQDVMDQEILYATKAGLSYFAFDTYCQYPRCVVLLPDKQTKHYPCTRASAAQTESRVQRTSD